MNGYFQIINNDNGVDLKIVHPTENGEIASIQEIVNFLNREKITFDLKSLNQALHENGTETLLHLCDVPHLPIAESAIVSVSSDRMKAFIKFYPPSNNGKAYRREDLNSELRVAKVVYGINEKKLDELFQKRDYCTEYLVANGLAQVEGHDAIIDYFFETDNKIRPTLREDGSVDFFNLNVLNHCKSGDLLARLTPEDRGTEGYDVFGNVLKPRDVKKQKLTYGLNIECSEDGLEIKSMVNGHVSLVDGKVFVADMLEVNNVDNSTGNIVYEGNVVVHGNVCANFSVIAHGNVEVKGVVEGAKIEATGNIVLARGMNGMSKGLLKADGNVIAKYLENCNVSAGGYVETESILHSNVQAGTEINVVSNKGFITGGSVSATEVIRVKTLGTNMGADTNASVGVDPAVSNRLNELVTETADAQKNLKVMLPVIEASQKKLASGVKMLPDQIKSLQQLALSAKQLQEKIIANTNEIESLKEVVDSSTNARVEINGEVFPGTTITISGVSMMVKSPMKFCAFKKQDGIVQMTTL